MVSRECADGGEIFAIVFRWTDRPPPGLAEPMPASN
jgi:hypothetical protein